MSIKDDLIFEYFKLGTNTSDEKLKEIEEKLKNNENPMSLKKELAFQIVSELHNEGNAKKAQEEFEKVVQNKEIPEDLQVYTVKDVRVLDEVLVDSKVAASKSEVKRLVEQGGIEINGHKISVDQLKQEVSNGSVIKVGKHKYLKIFSS